MILKQILFIILISSNILLANNESNTQKNNFGFLSTFNILDDFKDARSNLTTWLEKLGEEQNFSVNVYFYKDSKKILDDYNSGKLDLITINYYSFFENKSKLEAISSRYWTITYNKEQTYKLCLIKNNSVKFNSFKDLKEKSIILRKYDDHGSIWLDYQSLKSNNKTFKDTLDLVKYEHNESTSLLSVYFNKNNLALISEDTWNTMLELNPAISKRISVFQCSKIDFLPFVSLFSKKVKNEDINTFFKISDNMRNEEKIKNIHELFQFEKIVELEKDDLKAIDNFYNNYITLKKKYE
ncbi:hypothetical protein GCM10012288_18750 [Malaciobacter pacificus]|uniref:Uncharacterized protein n=1 Tax=Malaciobacter pacificus TaxID=1080223 RepID=A0A5C2H4F0_9BACT|nr:PhnD/SsuA/transferrin family substrate-binding protein [Malaciobacter pacificus]QEP33653.1 hypothetical protein APAC_0494 [Malaciobacter pacificus]GGD44681.1 hypothetical protein GCM10012288_18750 [Malaciobacter pacificus]